MNFSVIFGSDWQSEYLCHPSRGGDDDERVSAGAGAGAAGTVAEHSAAQQSPPSLVTESQRGPPSNREETGVKCDGAAAALRAHVARGRAGSCGGSCCVHISEVHRCGVSSQHTEGMVTIL